jgi:hypothetical protein
MFVFEDVKSHEYWNSQQERLGLTSEKKLQTAMRES